MMNWKIALLGLVSLPFTIMAAQAQEKQYTVKGTIVDSLSVKPVAYVTVGVLNKEGQPVAAAYSETDGSFKYTLPAAGEYTVVVTSIGYRMYRMPLIVPAAKKTVSLDTLFLAPGTQQLKEITVAATRQLVSQQPGMLVYNAENDLSNKGGTAADVLRKAPVLNVDAQGNVSMRGSTNLKILVNGKYSGQMARSAADALNMMPADMIKSVEVITTPSAKYDAEGAAGVINIITKKGRKQFSGALEVMASNWEQALNPRISFSQNKWNVNIAGHLHRLQSKTVSDLERITLTNNKPAGSLRQHTEKDNVMPHGSAEISVDYMADSLSEFSLGINTWLGNWPEDNQQTTAIIRPDGSFAEQYGQSVKTKANYLGADFSLGYNRKFSKPGQELTLLAQFSPSRDRSRYNSRQTEKDIFTRYRELNNSETLGKEWTLQADYTQPLSAAGKQILQGGIKTISRNVNNDYRVDASTMGRPEDLVLQPDRTDYFSYQQRVLAAYALLKVNFSHDWYAEAGARVEGTFIDGKFRSSGATFNNNFFNFVPTATVTKKLNEQQALSLSYTKRLTRPYIWDLNPNANASDAKNIVTGNPQLQPEIAHQAEFTYSLNTNGGLFLNAALYGKQTENSIEDYTTTDGNGISTTSKQNLATNRQFGLNVSATKDILPQWSLNGNVNVNHLDYKSGALLIINNGWAGDVNINTTYKLPANYALQAFGEYNSRLVTLQGHKTSRYYYSFSAKKELPAQKIVMTLSLVNPFSNTITQTEVLQAATFTSRMQNQYYNRAIKLTVNWEFGRMFDQRRVKKISNDDVKVQGKG
ncbi:TonB-dependent receptor domain-containing protein [Chitinophaga nivalis]|uniref:TonB-dependent receptor n=1 Tax=Chitinophaga nivalis TaxID=2991709 RepID=A0ABT3IQB2_9BACT|nr:TonB-dependent receptor [Chitinophaga nivalis]MCW3464177.1 TonB-dependent receptor [Chitinophaga nivalis]MCW3486133.1 TonB-dependent receptor [Chitinophaga nivalis]